MKRHLLFTTILLVVALAASAPTQKKGKLSLWAATLAKKGKRSVGTSKKVANKTSSYDDVPDAISRDRYAKATSLPEEEQKRIENMEEESKKRQYSADFDNAINAAQKAEEGIKQKERNHAEEITKAKERNATIHAEQLLKRKQKKLEERNKTAVRHEQNLKRSKTVICATC